MAIQWWSAVVMLALLAAPGSAQQPVPVDTAAIAAHLRFLASDLLEGRAPATRGGKLATAYIAAQFQALGLEPAGANGTYFQPVVLVGMTPQPTISWVIVGSVHEYLAYTDVYAARGALAEATSLVI